MKTSGKATGWRWLSATLGVLALAGALCGHRLLLAQVDANSELPITIAGKKLISWNERGQRYLLIQGGCFVEQGLFRLRSDDLLVRMEDGAKNTSLRLVAGGRIRVEQPGAKTGAPTEFTKDLTSVIPLRLDVEDRREAMAADHPLYAKLFATEGAKSELRRPAPAPLARGASGKLASAPADPDIGIQAVQRIAATTDESAFPVQSAQFSTQLAEREKGMPTILPAQFAPTPSALGQQPGPVSPRRNQGLGTGNQLLGPNLTGGGGVRRVRAFPRHSQDFNFDISRGPDGSKMLIFSGGVNVIVEEPENDNILRVTADRAVIWTKGDLGSPVGPDGAETDKNQPFELYLEGNVYVRGGKSKAGGEGNSLTLTGKQVYVNVNTNQALILNGAVETFDPQLATPFFVRADEIRQLNQTKFYAQQAGFTTSIYRGTPGYEFAANEVYFEEIKQRIKNPFTGQEVVDAQTNQPLVRTKHYATGYSNFLRVDDFPVFYWPYVRANVEDPLGPVEQIRVGSTRNLGTYGNLTLDMYQLLGLDFLSIADQSDWLGDVGYFSKRGIAGGSRFNYFGSEFLGLDGPYFGNLLGWYIDDHGEDFLGFDRANLTPPRQGRGRFRLQHRHDLSNDFTFIVEASYLSDENFLESFYEAEYDTGKDQETLVYLKQARDDWAWTALVQPRVNPFLPQNPWLPRLDGYLTGLSFLDDRLTYFNHSSVGYAQLRPPTQFPLAGDVELDVLRGDTRHEIDLPLQIGAFQVTPFAVGELTGYSDAIQADGVGRLYGAGGVRTSISFWRPYPEVRSDLLNLYGLAHKITLSADYTMARSNRDVDELPFLDQLDDDTSELVRRQNLRRRFGVVVPRRYDPRFYALRSNVITNPDILDDIQTLRLGTVNRLQTKRGPIGQQRIIDWVVWDVAATYFPEKNRDNLGHEFGLVESNLKWHIGDRTSYVSSLLFEPFDDSISIGNTLYIQRPPRLNFAVISNYFESGPFQSNYIGGLVSYRFSNKYSGAVTLGQDLANPNSLSYRLAFSRIGLDFITSFGMVFNAGRDDLGFEFEIYPRTQARNRRSRLNLETLPFGVDASDSVVPLQQQRFGVFNTSTNYGAF